MTMNKELPVIYTDRSRIEIGQRCLRKRYWEYHYQLPTMLHAGLQPAKPALELTVGSAVHKGVELLLLDQIHDDFVVEILAKQDPSKIDKYWNQTVLEVAVAEALADFDAAWQPWLEQSDAFQDSSESNQLLSYQLTEARALIEALIAAFYYAPTGLQLLTENYEILAVEQEIAVPLTDWLVLNSRPDAILRHRRTGQYFPWSLKTAKSWDDRTNQQAEVDNQGISESISTEWWLNQQHQGDLPLDATVSGVLMCYLIKGEKRADDFGIYRTNSPLIRPYFNTGAFDHTDLTQYAPSNKWTCTEEHEWKGARFNYQVNGKNGCPGNKNHMRGDSWQQVNIWEQGVRVQDWVKELFEQQPELGEKFVQVPAPYRREREELESWKRQIIYGEEQLRIGTAAIPLILGEGASPYSDTEYALERYFPQSRTSCTYPWKCAQHSLCHKGLGARLLDPSLFATDADPTQQLELLAESNLVGRLPNHPEGDNTTDVNS